MIRGDFNMLIKQTPKFKHRYEIINNKDMLYELALIGIMPRYSDEHNYYFVKSKELEEYLKNKRLEKF